MQSNNSSGKPLPPSYTNTRPQSHNHQISTNFGDSFQIDKTHVNIHEIDILDQTVEIIKILTIF